MSQTAQLAPMKAGGQWFQWPDDRPPVYVVHEAHQKRLSLEEGATLITDPRDPHAVRVQSDEAELTRRAQQLEAQVAQSKREEELRARIAELEAQLAERPRRGRQSAN